MKFSTFTLLSMLGAASATTTIRGAAAQAKLLAGARRLDQGEQGEFDYLGQYTLKMVHCAAGETVYDPNDGAYENSAVVVRLCPTSNGCDDDKACKEGYGDFVVGLNSYVQAFFEDQRDNMNWDDAFKVDEYAECREYEVEPADDDQANQYQQQYFIGPTCTDSGKDIKLAVFSDEACTYASETSFETISNGWTLPFESGGLVSTSCLSCIDYDDNGNMDLREMCQQLYESSANKCEEKMEYTSYYGANTAGCDYISELLPKSSSKNGGKIFGWFVFCLVVVGLGGYVMWWRKKKASANDGLMN